MLCDDELEHYLSKALTQRWERTLWLCSLLRQDKPQGHPIYQNECPTTLVAPYNQRWGQLLKPQYRAKTEFQRYFDRVFPVLSIVKEQA